MIGKSYILEIVMKNGSGEKILCLRSFCHWQLYRLLASVFSLECYNELIMQKLGKAKLTNQGVCVWLKDTICLKVI